MAITGLCQFWIQAKHMLSGSRKQYFIGARFFSLTVVTLCSAFWICLLHLKYSSFSIKKCPMFTDDNVSQVSSWPQKMAIPESFSSFSTVFLLFSQASSIFPSIIFLKIMCMSYENYLGSLHTSKATSTILPERLLYIGPHVKWLSN